MYPKNVVFVYSGIWIRYVAQLKTGVWGKYYLKLQTVGTDSGVQVGQGSKDGSVVSIRFTLNAI